MSILNFEKVAEKAGWFEGKEVKTEHIGFGVVTDMTGKKLSSRDGTSPLRPHVNSTGTPMTLAGLLTDGVAATEKAILATKSLLRSEKKHQQVQKSLTDSQYSMEGMTSRLPQLKYKKKHNSKKNLHDWSS